MSSLTEVTADKDSILQYPTVCKNPALYDRMVHPYDAPYLLGSKDWAEFLTAQPSENFNRVREKRRVIQFIAHLATISPVLVQKIGALFMRDPSTAGYAYRDRWWAVATALLFYPEPGFGGPEDAAFEALEQTYSANISTDGNLDWEPDVAKFLRVPKLLQPTSWLAKLPAEGGSTWATYNTDWYLENPADVRARTALTLHRPVARRLMPAVVTVPGSSVTMRKLGSLPAVVRAAVDSYNASSGNITPVAVYRVKTNPYSGSQARRSVEAEPPLPALRVTRASSAAVSQPMSIEEEEAVDYGPDSEMEGSPPPTDHSPVPSLNAAPVGSAALTPTGSPTLAAGADAHPLYANVVITPLSPEVSAQRTSQPHTSHARRSSDLGMPEIPGPDIPTAAAAAVLPVDVPGPAADADPNLVDLTAYEMLSAERSDGEDQGFDNLRVPQMQEALRYFKGGRLDSDCPTWLGKWSYQRVMALERLLTEDFGLASQGSTVLPGPIHSPPLNAVPPVPSVVVPASVHKMPEQRAPHVKLPFPAYFTGADATPSTVSAWCRQVQLFIAHNKPADPVLYALTFLRDEAARWRDAHLSHTFPNLTDIPWEEFQKALMTRFVPPVACLKALADFQVLKQTSTVEAFIAEFVLVRSELAMFPSLTIPDLTSQSTIFLNGLNNKISAQLKSRMQQHHMTDLDALMKLAAEIEHVHTHLSLYQNIPSGHANAQNPVQYSIAAQVKSNKRQKTSDKKRGPNTAVKGDSTAAVAALRRLVIPVLIDLAGFPSTLKDQHLRSKILGTAKIKELVSKANSTALKGNDGKLYPNDAWRVLHARDNEKQGKCFYCGGDHRAHECQSPMVKPVSACAAATHATEPLSDHLGEMPMLKLPAPLKGLH